MSGTREFSAITPPPSDPTKIFEYFRGCHATELLTAAVAHFDIFGRLSTGVMSEEELARALQLEDRPAVVLFTALRAMGLLKIVDGKLSPTELAANHLLPGGDYDVGNYVGLAATSPGVLQMVQLLRTNRPMNSDGDGAAFIYRDGIKSAMEAAQSARHLTLALAGRAKNVAPSFADAVILPDEARILDLGGGTGIYAYALMQKYPSATATILDRPEVLRVAKEMAEQYNVIDRVELRSGDMFEDELQEAYDAILLSNVLHDWDIPQCQKLVRKAANHLNADGQLVIHDVFRNDAMDGPLPIALYSASLFSLTEGRAYSAAEYRAWLVEEQLEPQPIRRTLVHCGVLSGIKRGG